MLQHSQTTMSLEFENGTVKGYEYLAVIDLHRKSEDFRQHMMPNVEVI